MASFAAVPPKSSEVLLDVKFHDARLRGSYLFLRHPRSPASYVIERH